MGERRRFRLFFAWDFQREEDWINRLSREKGLHLKRVGLCRYVFEEGVRGAYHYRLELLRRTERDAAEKQYLRTVGAEEVCRNGDWGYYRLPASAGPFAGYACCDSKLRYLKPLYAHYLVFGAAVYVALFMTTTAFLHPQVSLLHALVLASLTLLALGFTLGATRFHAVLRRLKRGAAEETGGRA